MEIKIKTSEGLVDTIIEIVDGVMIVSPKEEKFEPKDGDVFCVDSLCPFVGIVKEVYSYGKPDKNRLYFSVGYWKQSGDMQLGTFCACNRNTEPNYRPATEEEKQKLFDKLKEEGYEWDAEKKEIVKLKWKPKVNEVYYYPSMKPHKGIVMSIPKKEKNTEVTFDKEIIDAGWVFKNQEECQAFCNRLNDAINSVKP